MRLLKEWECLIKGMGGRGRDKRAWEWVKLQCGLESKVKEEAKRR